VFVDFGEKSRKFWVIASLIGICVCGALMLSFAVGGHWEKAGVYLLFTLCNVWTFETKRRKE
jgi:hypothetical protein